MKRQNIVTDLGEFEKYNNITEIENEDESYLGG